MKKIIDNTINLVKEKGVEPIIINLTDDDYKKFVGEVEVETRIGEDYADGYTKELQFYNGIEIDCRVIDEDEALLIHPMLSESHIASSTEFMAINFWIPKEPLTGKIRKLIPIEHGRGFNIRTLKEIL